MADSSAETSPWWRATFFFRHQPLVLLLVVAGALRLVTWLSLPPATWFSGDSFSYVTAAVHPAPGLWRPSGYSLLLLLPLRPFHSLAVVTAVQHLLGLAVGVAVYLLLLRYRVPRWAATLAVVPILLDAYLVSAEQMLLSEALFVPLVVAALTLLLWKPAGPGAVLAAVAGLLLGLGAVTRSVGLPLVAVAVVLLLVRRAGLVRVAALLTAAALPVGVYAAWYHHDHQRWGTSASGGLFLYGRVSQFVDCGHLNGLDPVVRALCPAESVGSRRPESYYVFSPLSPVQRLSGPMTRRNDLAGRFARQAVLSQPGDYLSECWQALVRMFSVPVDPTTDLYRLRAQAAVPRSDLPAIHGYDPGPVDTRPDPRGVDALLAYQRVAWVPGLACLVALLVAGAGAAFGQDVGRRGIRGAIWLLTGSATVLYLVPAMTVGPDVRYRVPTVPLLAGAGCLGLVLLAGRVRSVYRRRLAVARRPRLASPAAAGVELTGLERTRPDLPRIEAAGPEQATSGPTTRQPPEPRDVDTPGREAPAGQQGDDPEPGQPGPAT